MSKESKKAILVTALLAAQTAFSETMNAVSAAKISLDAADDATKADAEKIFAEAVKAESVAKKAVEKAQKAVDECKPEYVVACRSLNCGKRGIKVQGDEILPEDFPSKESFESAIGKQIKANK
jgi:hypothetical protein